MQQYVHITAGWTRGGATITDRTFQLLENIKRDKDGMYITVESDGGPDLRSGRNRIYMDGIHCFAPTTQAAQQRETVPAEVKTDEDISRDLSETFEILGEMARAVASGTVKGLVVSGPAGIGKSHTIESTLQNTLGMLGKMTGQGQMYEVISGGISAACLYEKLWEYRDDGKVVVFDDCDGVLYDEDSLNILKAALDSKKTRRISWNTRSLHLERKDIPNSFEFCGGIIFITNVKFDNIKSARIGNHLEAIVSRCHYMDIGIDTAREKLIHIRNVVERSGMLNSYQFESQEVAEVMDYVNENHRKLRELSLRMVLKISDLRKAMPGNWQRYVEKNCHRKIA